MAAVMAGVVADLDRRLAQIDGAVEKATAKGRTSSAMGRTSSAMALADQQRKTRTELVAQRTTAAGGRCRMAEIDAALKPPYRPLPEPD